MHFESLVLATASLRLNGVEGVRLGVEGLGLENMNPKVPYEHAPLCPKISANHEQMWEL